ncbi:MAG: hypothetical protein KAI64_02765, partial [Thermoplasmata archaeon]|nr:hypothetical protein [Thermoplasmata archaeon]
KSVKIRHVAVVFIVAFMILLPNVWFGMDSSIPYETKKEYDTDIYNSLPGVFRSDDYQEDRLWYLGAFGYSLPLKSRYWPTAYSWLSEQDNEIPVTEDRPAILSWWDYGFEFVQEGQHPTVADNFLDGYQLAGNFIMSQEEEDAIALLTIRVLEGEYHRLGSTTGLYKSEFSDEVKEVFIDHGLNVAEFENALKNPHNYVNTVLNDPEKYGPRSPDLSETNTKYVYLRGFLNDHLDKDGLVRFYHDIREVTGKSIRYFAVDSRLFPFTAQSTGIFYAPAKLSDHRIQNGVPIDFYQINAVSEFGAEYPIDEVPPGTTISEYKLVYNEMFYDSMFIKAFSGYTGDDLGTEDGIPGISEGLLEQNIQPAWNLSHFKVVYRTVYYNPHPPEEVENYTQEWRAMNYVDAIDLQRDIQEGRAVGTLDMSSRTSLVSGVVIIKYYDGAFINGTISIDGTTPFEGVVVTAHDEFGTPHDTTTTDAEGKYSVIAPFGEGVILTVSVGQRNNLTMVAPIPIADFIFNITDEQAMRLPLDKDQDGIYDYNIRKDIEVEGGNLSGRVFLDMDKDMAFGSTDVPIRNAT